MGIEIREENGRRYGRIANNNSSDKNKKLEDAKHEIEDIEAISIANSRGRGGAELARAIREANSLPTDKYKSKISNREKNKKKRTITGPKTFGKAKKFVLAALIVSAALIAGNQQITEYKAEAATRILNEVKAELGADAIYDNSTELSSNSFRQEFSVKKDGKTYRYYADIQDGETFVRENELDAETRKAISIAAAAQNGNVFDAIKANNYADKIEKGEINLTIDTRQKDGDGLEI